MADGKPAGIVFVRTVDGEGGVAKVAAWLGIKDYYFSGRKPKGIRWQRQAVERP